MEELAGDNPFICFFKGEAQQNTSNICFKGYP
jgi:hypothetical protein